MPPRQHRSQPRGLCSDGSYVTVPRTDYNYFVQASGMGVGPYALRVTDVYGNVLNDEGIAFVEAGEVAGVGQFPSCAGP